ncbi:hypothetical protein [Sphingomonas sp. 28-63-12]|uniref:hypothetical protein n=1 Tax=Sphingomonas sp. 28-63-12 TaxID=1970434 RepID=UPI000BD2966C|nr:MAG: hypothetical protein B7Y47_13865 [Sphingomonas sp. 28-63-12]
MAPAFAAASLVGAKFGHSASRTAWLWTANAPEVSTDFQLFVGSDDGRGEPCTRMLTAFIDVMISFWEGDEIALTIICPHACGETLLAAAPVSSRLRLRILTHETLACQPLTSGGGAGGLRLAAATQSKSQLICQFELGAFPVKPVAVRELIDLSLQQAAAASCALLVKAGLVVGRDRTGLKSASPPPPADEAVRILFGPESGGWLTEREKLLPDEEQLAALAVVECGHGVVQPLSAEDIVARHGRGWDRQPWLDNDSAFFVAITNWRASPVEAIVGHVYAAIHR